MRGGLSNLINVLLDPNPDIVIGLSTFEGIDEVGDSYLREKVSPTRVKDDVMTGVNLLQFNSDVLQVFIFCRCTCNRNVLLILK